MVKSSNDIMPRAAVRSGEPVSLPARAEEWVSSHQEDGNEGSLGFYWSILRRFQWRILTFVFCVTVLATLIALVLPKQYQSTAVLRIDPAGMRTVGENSQTNGTVASPRWLVTTEANVVVSPAVVQLAIQKLKLYQKKEFSPDYEHLRREGKSLTQADRDNVLRNVTAAISVNQPLDTYLLQVSFRSRSPQLSARVANQLLTSLIQHDYDTRVLALLGSSQSMKLQLDTLRAKMEQSQEALVNYESTHDILDPDSSDNIFQQRLSQINRDLGKAQSQRMRLQADYDIIQTYNLDALLASDRGQYLIPYQNRLITDENRLAQDAQVYGRKFPLYREQAGIVSHDRLMLRREARHIASQISEQYRAARRREKLLAAELQIQKAAMNHFNLKAIRYHALQAASLSYSKLYYELQQSIQGADVAANLHGENLRIISSAQPTDKPVFPRPLLTAFLMFIFSSLLACGVALGVGLLDRSVSSPDQVEYWFHVAPLASLPLVSETQRTQLNPLAFQSQEAGEGGESPGTLAKRGHSAFREGILGLHSAVLFAHGNDLHSLAITSALASEGKSTVSAHLAAVFSGLGKRVILVDADMRKPSIHRHYHLLNRRGLSTVLRGQSSLEQAIQEIPGFANLAVLPAGPVAATPAELLHLGIGDLLEQLRARYDFVLIDCPPVLGFADSTAIANFADGVVLVVRSGFTDRQHVAASLRQLRAARANLLGITLNQVEKRHGAYYYYEYSHYYGEEDASHEPESE